MSGTVQQGEAHAKRISEVTGRQVDFIVKDEDLWCFVTRRYQALKMIDIDGNVTQEAHVHDNPFKPNSTPLYDEFRLADCDLTSDKNIKMMVLNGWTRTEIPA